MDMTLFLEWMKRWGIKGGWSILDQGIFSGANFLLNIVLARWFSAETYGGYSVAFSIFLLISTAQVALIAEPMSIFGAGKYQEWQSKYLNLLLRDQWIGAFLSWVVVLPFFAFIRDTELRSSLIGMMLALPFVFGHWYMRRAYYLEARSDLALISSIVYAFSLLLTILILRSLGILSVFLAFLGMALASIIASMTTIKRLQISYLGSFSDAHLNRKKILAETWNFGKWILIAFIASWLTTMAFPSLIGLVIGLEQAGAFRAVQILFLPLQQFLAAITLLILPWLSKQRAIRGDVYLLKFTLVVATVLFLFSFLYCVIVTYFGKNLIALFYESTFYNLYSYVIIYFAIASMISSIPLVLGLTIRVLNQPKDILWSRGLSAIFVMTVGFAAIYFYHFSGVLFSLISGAVIEAFVLLFLYFGTWKKLARAQITT